MREKKMEEFDDKEDDGKGRRGGEKGDRKLRRRKGREGEGDWENTRKREKGSLKVAQSKEICKYPKLIYSSLLIFLLLLLHPLLLPSFLLNLSFSPLIFFLLLLFHPLLLPSLLLHLSIPLTLPSSPISSLEALPPYPTRFKFLKRN